MAEDRLFTRRLVAAGLLLAPASGIAARTIGGQDGQRPPPPGGRGGMRGPPPAQKPYRFEAAEGANGRCILIPDETEGPYPVNLIGNGKVKRVDIREGRPGIPLALELDIVDVRAGCAPVQGARVDIWQCDRDGIYSGVRNMALVPGARQDDTRGKTFLRGIQTTDATGRVRFVTIFPGWYPSRVTHIHFQVFLPDGRVVTSQIAFADDVIRAVYDSPLYRRHGQNTVVASNHVDNVFGDDDARYQLVTLEGDLNGGLKGRLPVAVIASRVT